MQALPLTGAMLSVFADEETCAEMVRPDSEVVSIAAVNGPQHVVLSGDSKAVDRIEAALAGRGIAAKRLNVSHAFHSPLMQPMVEEFGRVVAGVKYGAGALDVISSVTGLGVNGEIATSDYWRNQVLAPVRFDKAVESLGAMGIDAFVEIGPRPVLTAMAQDCLADTAAVWLPSLEPSGQNWRSMLEALGKLYTLGVEVNWRAVNGGPKRRPVPLPTYPFERQSYWLEEEEGARSVTLTMTAPRANGHPLLGRRLSEMAHLPGTHVWESALDASVAGLLEGHRVMGSTVVPYSAFVEMALAAAPEVCRQQVYGLGELALHHPLFVSKNNPSVVQVVLDELGDGNLSFKVFSRPSARAASSNQGWTLCASATIWTSGE
jgi:acyl transferase domain-containing protein